MNDYFQLNRTIFSSVKITAVISFSIWLSLQGANSGRCAETTSATNTTSNAGPANTAEVLPAETIFGKAKVSYMAAKKVPDVCAKLFCYCGCDSTDNHKSLLDCFTSDHGVDCNICQEEALIAFKMKEEGKTLAQIQKVVDQKYVAEYNSVFSEPGPMLVEYRKERLWKPTPAEALTENTVGKTSEEKAQEVKAGGEKSPTRETNAAAKKESAKSSAMSKKTSGSCCGHAH